MSQRSNTSHPTFSIIIPMKNSEQYISHALDSIADQKYNSFEILVIDDNSKDNSVSIVESWKQQHPQITVKSFKTLDGLRGPGSARNIGLDNASGKYILFLDSDDQLNNNALASIQNSIDNNPNTDIFVLGYQLTRLDFDENKVNTMNLPAGKLQASRFFQVGVNTAGTIWNTCTKKSLFDGKNGKNKIRFKENCIFEDFPTKVELFTRNKQKIKTVKSMTHTQFSRPCQSILGSLKFKDMKRLIEATKEVANLKPDVDTRDKMYINVRLALLPALLSWFTYKCMHNKIDILRKQKLAENEKDL